MPNPNMDPHLNQGQNPNPNMGRNLHLGPNQNLHLNLTQRPGSKGTGWSSGKALYEEKIKDVDCR